VVLVWVRAVAVVVRARRARVMVSDRCCYPKHSSKQQSYSAEMRWYRSCDAAARLNPPILLPLLDPAGEPDAVVFASITVKVR
jgi:hypothetical protein